MQPYYRYWPVVFPVMFFFFILQIYSVFLVNQGIYWPTKVLALLSFTWGQERTDNKQVNNQLTIFELVVSKVGRKIKQDE